MSKGRKKYSERKWTSPIELQMRNAIAERIDKHDLGIHLFDYSTSAVPAVFNEEYGDVLEQAWNVNPKFHEWGNEDGQLWSLYGDVLAKTYRLDLLLVGHCWGPSILINIECDGHQWHERTKQQASADRARDRDLLACGISVVRFTGSDVFNRADECAGELWDLAIKRFENTNAQRNIAFASGAATTRQQQAFNLTKAHASAYLAGVLGEVG